MRMTRIVALVPLLFPHLVLAAPVFTSNQWYIGDGGTYDAGPYLNGNFGINDGTLQVGPGASISSVSTYRDGGSVVLSGGEVQVGIWVDSGSLVASGGQARGGEGTAFAFDAAFVSSTARISGGTFIGGN